MGRGYQVAREGYPFPPIVYQYHLMATAVTSCDFDPDARGNLCITIQQAELSPLLQGKEIIAVVGRLSPLVRAHSLFPGGLLNIVGGSRKDGDGHTRAIQASAATTMVKMKVRQNNRGDIPGGQASAAELP